MTDPMLKLQILARSEMTLFRLQARRNATRTVLIAVALLFTLFTLCMLNFAGYQALTEKLSPTIASMIIASINGALALIAVLISRSVGPGADQEKIIREIRDLAYNELSADFDDVKAGLTKITEDVGRIRSGFSSFTGGSGGLTGNLGPILGLLIAAIKKSRGK